MSPSAAEALFARIARETLHRCEGIDCQVWDYVGGLQRVVDVLEDARATAAATLVPSGAHTEAAGGPEAPRHRPAPTGDPERPIEPPRARSPLPKAGRLIVTLGGLDPSEANDLIRNLDLQDNSDP